MNKTPALHRAKQEFETVVCVPNKDIYHNLRAVYSSPFDLSLIIECAKALIDCE